MLNIENISRTVSSSSTTYALFDKMESSLNVAFIFHANNYSQLPLKKRMDCWEVRNWHIFSLICSYYKTLAVRSIFRLNARNYGYKKWKYALVAPGGPIPTKGRPTVYFRGTCFSGFSHNSQVVQKLFQNGWVTHTNNSFHQLVKWFS